MYVFFFLVPSESCRLTYAFPFLFQPYPEIYERMYLAVELELTERAECQNSSGCSEARHHFEECQERVTEGKGYEGEDCVEELYVCHVCISLLTSSCTYRHQFFGSLAFENTCTDKVFQSTLLTVP